MTGTASRSPTRGIAQRDTVDQLVAGFAVPADHADHLAAADPVDDRRLEALSGQRHLEVVTMPPSTATWVTTPRLMVVTR